MIRKGIIALLTLATFAWTALWIDSYRPRPDVCNLRSGLAAIAAEGTRLKQEAVSQGEPVAGLDRLSAEYELFLANNYALEDLWDARAAGCAPATWRIKFGDRMFAVGVFRRCGGLESPPKRILAPGAVTLQVAPSFPHRSTPSRVDTDRRFAGFAFLGETVWEGWHRTDTGAAYTLRVPPWAVFLTLGAYPLIAFIRGPLRGWHRRLKGRCGKCGYDLTGNVSGTCAECGTAVVARRAARIVRTGESGAR